MQGVQLSFTVDMMLVGKEDITDPTQQVEFKSRVGEMSNILSTIIQKEIAGTEMDQTIVSLDLVRYLEPEDLEAIYFDENY